MFPPAADWQPRLAGSLLELRPLEPDDFEPLYRAASDPEIWAQHPVRDRHERGTFEVYFRGGLESRGALLVLRRTTGEIIGCSRYYDHDRAAPTVAIGYTFLVRSCWGNGYNRELKTLMLDYAFGWVETVVFHVGENNLRSRKAVEKLGAGLTGFLDISVAPIGPIRHCVYMLSKPVWNSRSLGAEKTPTP